MDDQKIIQLYWERSESALSETDSKYGKYCRYIARSILREERDGEECVNDAYMRAWNSIPPKRPPSLKAFLGRITRNLALDRYHHLTAAKRGFGQVPLALEELAECLPSASDTENAVDNERLTELLNNFLASQSKERRRIFVCRYWYMKSVKEIASDNGISESKVKMCLLRSRNELKQMLEKEGVCL